MYNIELTKTARKAYLKLPHQVQVSVYKKLQELAKSPINSHLDVKHLKGNKGYYRLRVGTYRVIYRLANKVMVIEVINIGHRKEIYK